MKEFDLWGWNYTSSTSATQKLVEHISQCTGNKQVLELAGGHPGGGKAFGLHLCELLVDKLGDNFRVPSWFHLLPEERGSALLTKDENANIISYTWGKYKIQAPGRELKSWHDPQSSVMVRSSAQDEDWKNAASGTSQSKRIWVNELVEKLRHERWGNEPMVVQEHAYGVGMVIDIGYSPLLERVVGRVASGRTHERFTSATWDSDGPCGLWDVETGERLFWRTRGCTGEFENSFNYAKLVTELYHALRRIGITFGVQLEVVVSTYNSMVYVVQLRPTPELVRGNKQQETPEPNKKPWAITAQVGMAHAPRTGQCILLRDISDRSKAYRTMSDWSNTCRPGPTARYPEEKPFAGKVIVWDGLPSPYSPGTQAWAMSVLGAIGIVGLAMRTNTAHGTPGGEGARAQFLPRWNETAELSTLLSLPGDQVRDLAYLIRGNPSVELTVVSDGLVGQVFINP